MFEASSLLRLFALGNVRHQCDQMCWFPLFVMQGGNELVNPHLFAIFVNVSIFGVKRGDFSGLQAANKRQISFRSSG